MRLEWQWKIFAAHAQQKSGEFHIMIPKDCRGIAARLVKELGIEVKQYWWPSD